MVKQALAGLQLGEPGLSWISYGTVLRMHLFAGWSGRRLAGWCLFVFAMLVGSYRLIVYFPTWSTYHILDMDLSVHIPD